MEEDLFRNIDATDFFGPLYSFIEDDDITDIDYNGSHIWITKADNTREMISEICLSNSFIDQFSSRVANLVSKPFHKQSPILEAETTSLRITILHESVAMSGRCICIRKTPPFVRLNYEGIIDSGYASEAVLDMMIGFVKQHKNIVVCGEPGAGKTELCKFLSTYIADDEKVITIEDTREWHYKSLNPDHDTVEIKIGEMFDYTAAIKSCLRLNPKWIMLSETRSREVVYLLESFSTGVKGMTTLHTSDVSKIVDRIINMAGDGYNRSKLENDIYSFIDIGILVKRSAYEDESGRMDIRRYIDQICVFEREAGINRMRLLVDNKEQCEQSLE